MFELLYEALTNLVNEVIWFAASANHQDPSKFDPDGERVNLASTARRYRDVVRHGFHLLDEDDAKEVPALYYRLRGWNHRLHMTIDYLEDDPYSDEEDDGELAPGEVRAFLTRYEAEVPLEGPYLTDKENIAFFEAQRGGYSYDTFGQDDRFDDHDTRDVSDGWAEYLAPVGMSEFYGSAEWQMLLEATSLAIREADRLRLVGRDKWGYVASAIYEDVVEAFDAAVKLYLNGEINTVAMALVVHKFVSPTRFSRNEMVELTSVIPAVSHVDGSPLGITLYRWMQEYQGEVDEILEDGWDPQNVTSTPEEESKVAEMFTSRWELALKQHWLSQAKQRKPALVENGQKIWSSCWAGPGDVEYNFAYLMAVIQGGTVQDAIDAGNSARLHSAWVPNNVVVSADAEGLILRGGARIAWVAAAERIARLQVEPGRQAGLLAQLRTIWVQSNGARLQIQVVGEAVKAMA